MNLIGDIALTHLRGRLRQTTVAVAGVATGVGFSIGMAALMASTLTASTLWASTLTASTLSAGTTDSCRLVRASEHRGRLRVIAARPGVVAAIAITSHVDAETALGCASAGRTGGVCGRRVWRCVTAVCVGGVYVRIVAALHVERVWWT